ncbi:hypothetical protein GNF68_16750, partial [Clostridium perfringens]|nr:hypothetical protein [Clostridium perfringens]
MRKKYLIVLVMTFAIFIAGCSKSNTNIKEYVNSGEAIELYAKKFMPAFVDLSKYIDLSYEYYLEYFLFFIADSMALVVGYDEENYKSEKEKLTNNYTFLNEKITDQNSSYIIP